MKTKPEILRTKFKGEIISEFVLPKKASDKVVIFCHGMPGVPKHRELLEFLSEKGFWVFLPRYRGSWESSGEFLKASPHHDILDMFDEISSGFTDFWTKKKYAIPNPKIYLFGSSFGGPAAILASRDNRVEKAVCTCAVIDWQYPSEEEPMDQYGPFVKEAFGEGYRFTLENWNKLLDGKFYSPKAIVSEINGKKLFLIHAKDDKSVNYKPTVEFAAKTGSKLVLLEKGGHIGSDIFMDPKIYKEIQKFLKN